MTSSDSKPARPAHHPEVGDISPEAGIDRDPQSGQARNDRSLTDKPVDHLPDGATDSTHKPNAKN